MFLISTQEEFDELEDNWLKKEFPSFDASLYTFLKKIPIKSLIELEPFIICKVNINPLFNFN